MRTLAGEKGTRRDFIRNGGVFLGLAAVAGAAEVLAKEAPSGKAPKGGKIVTEISPTEDRMQEHAVLSRILLIYEEMQRRLQSGRDFPL
jgi:hypothetical protein